MTSCNIYLIDSRSKIGGIKPSFFYFFLMGEEAYQIKNYFHDEVVAFARAMNPKGKLACNEDEMY